MSIQAGEQINASDFVATSAGAGDAGKSVKLDANGKIDESFVRPPVRTVYTADGTWNKPTGLKYIIVKMWGGGGSGAACQWISGGNSGVSAGGSGGEYAEKRIEAADLASSVAVTVGAGGGRVSPNNDGNNGEDSSFGSHLTAAGGIRGELDIGSPPVEVGSDGGGATSFGHPHAGIASADGAKKNATEGGGAGGWVTSSSASTGGNSVRGGAGGGSANEAGNTSAGGVSKYGGDGGDGGKTNAVNAEDGSIPGGGGGGWNGTTTGHSADSGAGARGQVEVEEFFA